MKTEGSYTFRSRLHHWPGRVEILQIVLGIVHELSNMRTTGAILAMHDFIYGGSPPSRSQRCRHRGLGDTNPIKILNFVTAGGSFFSIIKGWAPAGYKSLHSPVSFGRNPHQKMVTNWLQTGPKRLQTVPESYVLLRK